MGKLIKLSEVTTKVIRNQHYIIVDDSEIKEGDWFYQINLNRIIKHNFKNGLLLQPRPFDKKITHSTQPLSDKPHYAEYGMLTVPAVEEAIYGYSVEKMMILKLKPRWEHLFINGEIISKPYPTNFQEKLNLLIEGFDAHKKLVKDKLFTVEDMRKMYDMSCGQIGLGLSSDQTENNKRFDDFIKSILPPTSWAVTFDEQGKLKLI